VRTFRFDRWAEAAVWKVWSARAGREAHVTEARRPLTDRGSLSVADSGSQRPPPFCYAQFEEIFCDPLAMCRGCEPGTRDSR
jgi:hypothetical protein